MNFLLLGDIFPSAIPLLKRKIPYLVKKIKLILLLLMVKIQQRMPEELQKQPLKAYIV